MSPRAGNALEGSADARTAAPQAVALSVHTRRNIVVQSLGLAMVVLGCLNVTPWPYVAGWTVAALCVLGVEDQMLRAAARGGPNAGRLAAWAPALRIMGTCLYALAALTLIARGGPPERLLAFALICASCMHVLMRYYRTRWTLLAALAPYIAILGLLAVQQVSHAIKAGHPLGALVATFTLGTFTLQFWSARGQLTAAWNELMGAREAAEERERAAEAASRAKSNFLATMSHELRTPLNGVLGMAQAMTHERLSDTQRERVKIIRRSSESLLAVLNDLLDLSKIETSSLELELGEFDLEHLVRGVVAAYEPLAKKKGLGFSFAVSEAACGAYMGDSARIRRILYSLADNAVKFTDAGGVTLSVDRENGQVVFRVDDSGIGIEEPDAAHLFEGFFQADASLSRRHGGAGLGLAICREMTNLMGGSIEAISELGAGSTFVVRLPLAPAATRSASAPDTAAGEARSGEVRVLAAEDNDTNQLVLKTLLAQAGIDVTMVANGRQALEAWEAQDWDIILMDIQMPVMDGVDATREIRRRERETGRARTPILAVTANAMTHQVTEYDAAGMDGMVPKPIDITALFGAMQQALEPPQTDAAQASAA
jgi:signal transduction histidine kinase/ActR/RegA family two-component response regulator